MLLRPVSSRSILVNATLLRRYSLPPSTTCHSQPPPPPIHPPPKKPRLDLRPLPLKPARLPGSKPPRTKPKQESVKEATQRDIHDAEAHGILTPPPQDANWFKRTLHQAIQLAKFYYRGVRLIFARRKDIALIRARIKDGGPPLTRAEYRLIQTQKDDVNKVIPFLIIAILLEEVIPLIAIYAPFMLPSTCILPSQRDRIEAKRAEKAQSFITSHKHIFTTLKRAENPVGFLPFDALRMEGAPTAICGLLGLSTIGIDFLRIRRIRNHLESITTDDQFLLHDDMTTLTHRQLQEALQERGIWTITPSASRKDLHARLSLWLDAVKDASQEAADSEYALSRRLALLVSRH